MQQKHLHRVTWHIVWPRKGQTGLLGNDFKLASAKHSYVFFFCTLHFSHCYIHIEHTLRFSCVFMEQDVCRYHHWGIIRYTMVLFIRSDTLVDKVACKVLNFVILRYKWKCIVVVLLNRVCFPLQTSTNFRSRNKLKCANFMLNIYTIFFQHEYMSHFHLLFYLCFLKLFGIP